MNQKEAFEEVIGALKQKIINLMKRYKTNIIIQNCG